MATRRQFITGVMTASTVTIAGCGGDGPEAAAVGMSRSDRTHEFDVDAGDTIRVDVENEEGRRTVAEIVDPNSETVTEAEVITEETITHTATEKGVYTVSIRSSRRGVYQIYIE